MADSDSYSIFVSRILVAAGLACALSWAHGILNSIPAAMLRFEESPAGATGLESYCREFRRILEGTTRGQDLKREQLYESGPFRPTWDRVVEKACQGGSDADMILAHIVSRNSDADEALPRAVRNLGSPFRVALFVALIMGYVTARRSAAKREGRDRRWADAAGILGIGLVFALSASAAREISAASLAGTLQTYGTVAVAVSVLCLYGFGSGRRGWLAATLLAALVWIFGDGVNWAQAAQLGAAHWPAEVLFQVLRASAFFVPLAWYARHLETHAHILPTGRTG